MTEVPAAGRVLSPVAEPGQRVAKRWIALIALANLGLRLGYYGPLGVLVPNQVQDIAGPSGKVAVLGWVTGTGAAVAMVCNPIAGALSDRTTGRFGRPAPCPSRSPRPTRRWPARTGRPSAGGSSAGHSG